MIGHEVAL